MDTKDQTMKITLDRMKHELALLDNIEKYDHIVKNLWKDRYRETYNMRSIINPAFGENNDRNSVN